MTIEEVIKPKKPKKKQWVGLTESEINIILCRHERDLDAPWGRSANVERWLIFDVQNVLKGKNT